MQLAKRTKKNKDGRSRSQKHLRFVRSHKCLVDGCDSENIEAHHVGDRATSAMGLKPSDEWAVPLCSEHHAEGHNMGWRIWSGRRDVDLRTAALWFAQKSPDLDIRKAGAEHE